MEIHDVGNNEFSYANNNSKQIQISMEVNNECS